MKVYIGTLYPGKWPHSGARGCGAKAKDPWPTGYELLWPPASCDGTWWMIAGTQSVLTDIQGKSLVKN